MGFVAGRFLFYWRNFMLVRNDKIYLVILFPPAYGMV